MAFTASDLTNIETAMVALAVDGIATVTVGGQTVTVKSLDELNRLRQLVADNVSADLTHGGMRLRQMKPGGCG
jgi:hypothetical protein